MQCYATKVILNQGVWKFFQNVSPPINNATVDVNVEVLNDFFCRAAFLDPGDYADTLLSKTCVKDDSLFCVKKVSNSDLFVAWEQMKNTHIKNEDHMGILNFMLDVLLPLPLPATMETILKFVNISFTSGIVPNCLKIAKVIPIPKVCHPKVPGDYRLISITPNITLLLEKNYLNKLKMFL